MINLKRSWKVQFAETESNYTIYFVMVFVIKRPAMIRKSWWKSDEKCRLYQRPLSSSKIRNTDLTRPVCSFLSILNEMWSTLRKLQSFSEERNWLLKFYREQKSDIQRKVCCCRSLCCKAYKYNEKWSH